MSHSIEKLKQADKKADSIYRETLEAQADALFSVDIFANWPKPKGDGSHDTERD